MSCGRQDGGREVRDDVVQDPQRFCPVAARLDESPFVNGDGTDLRFKDDNFKKKRTCALFRHFGGHEAAARAMQEMSGVTLFVRMVACDKSNTCS